MGRTNNKKIEELHKQLDSIYAEAALKVFGEDWIADLDSRLKEFIELDQSGNYLSSFFLFLKLHPLYLAPQFAARYKPVRFLPIAAQWKYQPATLAAIQM